MRRRAGGTRGYETHPADVRRRDEATCQPLGLLREDIRMGADHPLVWVHCVSRGRAAFSALNHFPAAYAEPLHRMMPTNAVAGTAGLSGGEACRNFSGSHHELGDRRR
jgi:type 1 glutamine amidotransferase